MFYKNKNAALHIEPLDGSMLPYALRSRCSRAPSQEDIRSRLNVAWPLIAANAHVAVQETSTFDDLGRRLTQTDPLNNTWQYQYDLNSNLTQITDPKGQIVDRTWLRGGLLDVQTTSRYVGDPTPHVINYNYNDLGQVIEVISPEVSYVYQYDAAHRLSSEIDGRGGKTLAYRYSPGGMLDAVNDNEGNQTDYLYDPVGRLTGIWAANDDLVSFVRDAGGRLAEKWFVNGTNTRYSYNADNSLAQLTNRSGTGALISQHTYTHGGFGNRESASDEINTVTRNLNYEYDPLNRLTAVRDADTANSLIEGYSYDPLDRRRTLTAADNSVRVYVHDAANQLNTIENPTGTVLTSFGYDTNGNLTSKSAGGTTLSLSYDALDRLVQANKTGLPAETYTYDPQGRRIEKTEGGAPTRYRYLGSDIYTEYGTDWTQATALYTQGPGADDALIRSNTNGLDEHYQRDGLGSVVSVTDTAGTIQGTARYDAWGNTTQTTGSLPRYGYTGREPDATGLIYYRARYYDPEVGRFTQRDPKGFIDGVNRYAYAINNPVNFTDPNGTSVISGSQRNTVVASKSYFPTGNQQNIPVNVPQIASGNQSLAPPPPQGSGYSSSTLDRIQLGLDIAGLVPGIGELADLVNAGISLSRGDTAGASLSFAAAIPFIGAAATVGKLGSRTVDALGVGKITGYTRHGLNHAIGRNGGKGVNAKEMLNAVRNPKKVIEGSNGATVYRGQRATVILNSEGKVITTYGKSRGTQIWPQGTNRPSGSGSARRRANELGFSYNPNAIR